MFTEKQKWHMDSLGKHFSHISSDTSYLEKERSSLSSTFLAYRALGPLEFFGKLEIQAGMICNGLKQDQMAWGGPQANWYLIDRGVFGPKTLF